MSLPPLLKEAEGTDAEWKRRAKTLVNQTVQRTSGTGPTSERPPKPMTGWTYFDETLGKPIWWRGNAWIDATGATV